MNQRTLLFAAAAAVALLIAGYSAYWWTVAGRLDAGLDAWIAAERASGVAIDADRTPIGGFPLAFRATFRHPHVSGTAGGQPLDWQGADVEAHLWPFDLRTLHLTTAGDHRVVLGSATVSLHAETIEVRLGFNAKGLVSDVGAESQAATVTLADGRQLAFQAATAAFATPQTPPLSDHDPLLHFGISATALQLPPQIRLLTDGPVDSIALQGTVKGPIPPAPLRQALAAWRDHGGAVDITSFSAAQAPLSVSGSATIALDADLQPIIAADLKAKGLSPTIDLLASQHRVAQNDVLKMKLFVAATEHDASGGGKEVQTGLTIQNGFLSWGAFRLARVARIDWP